MTAFRLAALAIVLTTGGTAVSFAQDSTADGERLFRTRCAGCHSIEAGQNRVGPHLGGLMGRTAGTVEGARYSSGLRDSGIVWNEQALDAYLTSPRQAVPGTTMTINLPNASQRAAIISYLRTLTGDGA